MSTFHKVEKGNNWGSIWYGIPAKAKPILQSQSKIIPLKCGTVIEVLWPNEEITQEIVASRPLTNWVSDMGREYSVSTEELGLVVGHKGKVCWVDLDGLEVRLVEGE